jgi:signal-transduction protein with cAMP-binding, CBS, and nucleotidyltransferase domain
MITSQNTVLYDPLELDNLAQDIDLHLRSSGMLTDAEIEVMRHMITIKTVKKGSFLLKEGQIAAYVYYILKGCVREYYLKDGEEKTISFYTEGDDVSANRSYILQVPSKHYLECSEDTTLTVMSHDNDVAFKKQFPRLAIICYTNTEEELGNYQDITAEYMVSTPEERYLKLVETRPDLLNRVPQYQLASYIGVTPESLSRIRNRIRLNN